jgi:hypothetical protein
VPSKPPAPQGPRGGTTTRFASGLVRTTVHLQDDELEYLRRKGFAEQRSVSELIREAIRAAYPDIDELEAKAPDSN